MKEVLDRQDTKAASEKINEPGWICQVFFPVDCALHLPIVSPQFTRPQLHIERLQMISSPTGPIGRGKIVQAVSLEMQELRAQQTELNKFLWSSELTYKHFLHNVTPGVHDAKQMSHEVLAHIGTEAWYPNAQGFIKMDTTIGKLLLQVEGNSLYIYRAVMVYFFAAFEQFLKRRARRFNANRSDDWGPYFESLRDLTKVKPPLASVRPVTLLRADICRRFRNELMHVGSQMPRGVSDPRTIAWRSNTKAKLGVYSSFLFGGVQEMERAVDATFEFVIGNAEKEQANAKAHDRELPIEHFYAIHTFTNLTNLALEVEEAVCPLGVIPIGRVWRSPADVRRADLIVNDPLPYAPIEPSEFQRLLDQYGDQNKKEIPEDSPKS